VWNLSLEHLEQVAEAVKNAPSVFNSQPWSFMVPADDRIELYAKSVSERYEVDQPWWDISRGLDGTRHLDPLAREFAISCGAALYNLRLAIRVEGHDFAVRLPPHPVRGSALLASVEIMTGRVKPPTQTEQELYEAIWRCPVNRRPYTIVAAPLPIIVAMEDAAAQEGASLRLLHPHQIRSWQRLVSEADRFFENKQPGLSPGAQERYRRHREYRDDLIATKVKNVEDVGVPRDTFGPAPKGPLSPTRKDFWLPGEPQRFERPGLRGQGSSKHLQLMALSTDDDRILDWLRAGQALQHAILTATRYSISPPYGITARYHAPYRYGVPGRHHTVRGSHRGDLAYYGLSVSLLTKPLERYDIERENAADADSLREDSRRRPRPLPWRFAELPQVVIRVGYAVDKANAAPRRNPEILDIRSHPPAVPAG